MNRFWRTAIFTSINIITNMDPAESTPSIVCNDCSSRCSIAEYNRLFSSRRRYQRIRREHLRYFHPWPGRKLISFNPVHRSGKIRLSNGNAIAQFSAINFIRLYIVHLQNGNDLISLFWSSPFKDPYPYSRQGSLPAERYIDIDES